MNTTLKTKIQIPIIHCRKSILLFFFVAFSPVILGQTFGDKEFYLVDSLDLSTLSPEDKILIDTCLQHYHNAKHDTTALDYIEHIVDECWNEEVWPKYNRFVYLKSSTNINHCYQKEEFIKYASLVAGAVSNLGYVCDNEGNIPGALKHYHKALNIYERIGDLRGCASSFNNLGVLYNTQSDTAKALFYHNESLRIKKHLGDEKGVALSLNNVGTIYKDQGRAFEALHCFEKSLRIARDLEDERIMAIAFDNIAGIYFKEGYPTKAIDYYNQALTIRNKNGEYSGAAFSMNNIATVYLSLGDIAEAEKYALSSFELANKVAFPLDILNASETLYKINKVKKNYENSLFYHELFLKMKDSLHNVNNERELLGQSLKYQYEKESLKDSLEHTKIQEIQDLQIKERDAQLGQEKILRYAFFGGILILLYVVYISVRNFRRKQKDNELIQKQKQEVEVQKQKIEKQHHILEETYKEISDSITYAKRIQQAILPPDHLIKKNFVDCFTWFLPKHVVSGDFYWKENLNTNSILAVSDCTGHGVPGAMVSVVCHNALNRSVLEFGLKEPKLILDKTRQLVIETFDKSGSEVKDGMDICMISIDTASGEIKYAGANNNLYIIRSGLFTTSENDRIEVYTYEMQNFTLFEFKSDKQPIGRFSKSKSFTQIDFKTQPGDCIYLFSDGLADQFGGPKGKKFKYQQFKELLIQNAELDLEDQMKKLQLSFENWKGELEQVDDICVIGLRV